MDNNELVEIKQNTIKQLDNIKHQSHKGFDYWSARELGQLLGYTADYRNFRDAIERARMALESSGGNPRNHFGEVTKMIEIGKGAKREIDDILLTRYACYLIAMNGDPSKPDVAAAQVYFAVQTRKQELAEQHSEAEDRLELRDKVKDHTKYLNMAAKEAGVNNYAFFHDAGYKGLYGDIGLSDIKRRKGISAKENLLDCIGRAELAANDFRITQTELTLRKEKVKGQKSAEDTHYRVSKEVRTTIKKLGGMAPENLPAEQPIKQLEKAKRAKELPPSST